MTLDKFDIYKFFSIDQNKNNYFSIKKIIKFYLINIIIKKQPSNIYEWYTYVKHSIFLLITKIKKMCNNFFLKKNLKEYDIWLFKYFIMYFKTDFIYIL